MAPLHRVTPALTVMLALALLLITGKRVKAFTSGYDDDDDGTYEWDVDHSVILRVNDSKGICFTKGSTSCVEYTTTSSYPVLSFVTKREDATKALEGQTKVAVVDGSVCNANICNIKVSVSEKSSYCLVILNRGNEQPSFRRYYPRRVALTFKVNGCPNTFWTVIAVVIVIVFLIAIFACCIACCVHFMRKRHQQQQLIQMGPVAHGTVLPAPPVSAQAFQQPPGRPGAHPQNVFLGSAVPPNQQPIQFLEAKL